MVHHEMTAATPLPIDGARLIAIDSTPPEGMLVLPEHGGVIVSGDCLQNWHAPDAYFSWLGRTMMKQMGFLKPHNIGPGWLKQCKRPKAQLRGLLDQPFAHVLPAHGAPVIGAAAAAFRPALERVAIEI